VGDRAALRWERIVREGDRRIADAVESDLREIGTRLTAERDALLARLEDEQRDHAATLDALRRMRANVGAVKRSKHGGNCMRDATVYGCKRCGRETFCDVCHAHDAPRGECRRCPVECPGCADAPRNDP
jgi:hypothetical protein